MNILHTVQNYAPSLGGAQEVVKQLSERMVELGHKVTVATAKHPDRHQKHLNGVNIMEFNISGSQVRGYTSTKKEILRYQDFLINNEFDVIMNYAAQHWATDLMLEILPQIKSKKVLVPCGYSGLKDESYKEYFEKLPDLLKQYEACIYLSNSYQDRKFADQYKLNNSYLIPNGASLDEFVKSSYEEIPELNLADDSYLILHVGSHTGYKGHSAAIKMFEKANIENSVLVINGNDFGSGCKKSCHRAAKLFNLNPINWKKNKKIILTNLKRDDLVKLYHRSNLFLFPSEIECSPIVLFEAAASRTPFVSSPAGNAEEINRWLNSGKIIPSRLEKDRFHKVDVIKGKKIIEYFYNHPKISKRLSDEGWHNWSQNFTWESITKKYLKLYETI